MDEKPKCSYNAETTTQEPAQKDQLASQKEQTAITETESKETKPPKIQPIHTMDQSTDSKDQPDISKEQTNLPNIHITSTKLAPSSPEEQVILPIVHFYSSLDEVPSSKVQTNMEIHIQTAKDESVSKDQTTSPITHTGSAKDVSSSLKRRQTTEISINTPKNESASSEKLIKSPINYMDTTQDASLSSTEQITTEIHINTTNDESASEEQVIMPIVHFDYSTEESPSSKAQTSTKNYVILAKRETVSSDKLMNLPLIYIDSTKDESSSSKRGQSTEIPAATFKNEGEFSSKAQTTMVNIVNTTKDKSASSEDLATAQNNQIASTRGESLAPKNEAVASTANYSGRRSPRNYASGNSLQVEKEASTTLSFNTNNCYFVSSNAPLKINSSTQSPNTSQPASRLPASVAVGTQPPSLFLQALSKLDDSSLTLSVVSHFGLQASPNLSTVYNIESGDITPPDSLSSAPPTYSFVLRQMAVRRRPRFMGTFIPSPSFVQQTPPPTYTGAYDVYIEPAIPPPPPRVYTYGFTSMPIVCPECGYTGMTVVTSHVTICTHLCAFILCLLCCWVCAPLPYILRSCKDVYHYCRNCRSFLGMYCPTNPENVYPNV